DETHFEVRGTGEHTLVFISGLGDSGDTWADVVAKVSRDFTVFTYDRPGYGRSPWNNRPRDAQSIAHELRTTLAAAKLRPPFILVAHSIGGFYARVFAALYPRDTAALVLIDPSSEDFLE